MTFDAPIMNPAINPTSLQAPSTKGLNMEKINAAAQDFEAMFLSEMLKPMFESVKVDETFGGGKGEEIFGGFLRDEYAKIYAGTGSLGIADLVKQQLIDMQSKAAKPEVAQNMQGNMGTITTGESDV